VFTGMNTEQFEQRFAKHGKQNTIKTSTSFLTSSPRALTPMRMIVPQRQSVTVVQTP
jgi:hypothetical protein